MNTILVGYDLNRPGQNYSDLVDYLKSFGTWWHHLDSTWLVKTGPSPTELRDRLSKHIDNTDELLVIDVTSQAAAWLHLNDKASEWLRSNL